MNKKVMIWGPIILVVLIATAAIGLSVKQKTGSDTTVSDSTKQSSTKSTSEDATPISIDSTLDQITNDAVKEQETANASADTDANESVTKDQEIINSTSNDNYDINF